MLYVGKAAIFETEAKHLTALAHVKEPPYPFHSAWRDYTIHLREPATALAVGILKVLEGRGALKCYRPEEFIQLVEAIAPLCVREEQVGREPAGVSGS